MSKMAASIGLFWKITVWSLYLSFGYTYRHYLYIFLHKWYKKAVFFSFYYNIFVAFTKNFVLLAWTYNNSDSTYIEAGTHDNLMLKYNSRKEYRGA